MVNLKLKQCELPLTGKGVVHRLITDLAVFDFTKDGMQLIELAEGVSLEEVKRKQPLHLQLLYNNFRPMTVSSAVVSFYNSLKGDT